VTSLAESAFDPPAFGPAGPAVALAGHELRQPLIVARRLLEAFLVQGERGAGDVALVHHARNELDGLSELMDVLLNWSAEGPCLVLERVDLMSVVRDAVTASGSQEEIQRVLIDGPGRLLVTGDGVHLRMAVANLIRNALAYSPPEEVVSVVVSRRDGCAWVSVSDAGPGIDPDERGLVFEAFRRGKAGRASRSGSGLGLFLVKHVVAGHGGRLEVESDPTGTTVRVAVAVGRGFRHAVSASHESGGPAERTRLMAAPDRLVGEACES